MNTILFSVFSSNFAPSRRCWLLPRTWSHLCFAGVRECPPWCSIVGATVTVHQSFCILRFCHTCSLCYVELVVQFPARGSTRVLLYFFPGVLWLRHFLCSVCPHPVSSLYIYTFVVSRAFMAGAASQAGDADSCRAPGLTSGLQGSVNVHRGALLLVPQWQCISSFVFYNVAHDETMNPIDCGGRRSKVKVIIDGSKNNFVNTKKLKLFSVFWLHLAQMLFKAWEDWTLLMFGGQKSKSHNR